VKRKYPRNKDIEVSVLRALSQALVMHPDELPSIVFEDLEERGFDTTFVNVKRIWRIYRDMVLKGRIYDILDVVRREKHKNLRG